MPWRLGIYFCNNLFFFSSHGWKKMTVCKNHRSNAISDLPVGACDAFNIDRRLWWGAKWSQCISFFVCLQIFLFHILISKITHRVFLESARLQKIIGQWCSSSWYSGNFHKWVNTTSPRQACWQLLEHLGIQLAPKNCRRALSRKTLSVNLTDSAARVFHIPYTEARNRTYVIRVASNSSRHLCEDALLTKLLQLAIRIYLF